MKPIRNWLFLCINVYISSPYKTQIFLYTLYVVLIQLHIQLKYMKSLFAKIDNSAIIQYFPLSLKLISL